MTTLAMSTMLVTLGAFACAQAGLSWWQMRATRHGDPTVAQPAAASAVAALVAVLAGLAAMDADALDRVDTAPSQIPAGPSQRSDAAQVDAIAQLDAYVKRIGRNAPPPMTPIPGHSQGDGLPDVETMIARLANRLETDTADADGWRTLGWSYLATGNSTAAVGAYQRAMTLRPADIELKVSTAEAMVKAAGDIVDARSVELLDAVLRETPDHPRARFYRAITKQQSGDAKSAVEEWTALLAAPSDDASWKAEIEERIAKASASPSNSSRE